MDNSKFFFAVDLGATSGRTILGTLADGKFSLEELTRFDNNLIQTGGHFYWDIYALYNEIIKGLKLVAQRQVDITSIGIDTWGVDFVCVGKDKALLRNPLAYRDPHTFGMMEEYFEKCVDKQKVYDITGIQFMNFNSLFQLYAMRHNGDSALENADKVLFVPDCLSYMLTGKMVCEYTIASTSQILDPRTKQLDEQLLASVGLTREHFGEMVNPATVIGTLTPEVQTITGLGAVPVIAVAGHDTGSAVAAVPARDEQFAYLSSGTWSLMGIETKEAVINDKSFEYNFTNEGGIEGTTRFLKNICGMWLYERCRKEWTDAPKSHTELQAEAMKVTPARGLCRDLPLHLRQSGTALPSGVRMAQGVCIVPHPDAPYHRWWLAQRISRPVHRQLHWRGGARWSARGHGHRKHHAPGQGLWRRGRHLGDAQDHRSEHRDEALRAAGQGTLGCCLRALPRSGEIITPQTRCSQ